MPAWAQCSTSLWYFCGLSLRRQANQPSADVPLPTASLIQHSAGQWPGHPFYPVGISVFIPFLSENILSHIFFSYPCRVVRLPVWGLAADLAHSSVDPLARSVRHQLRRLHSIDTGVDVRPLHLPPPTPAPIPRRQQGAARSALPATSVPSSASMAACC